MKQYIAPLLVFSLALAPVCASAKSDTPFGGSSKGNSKQPIEITSDALEVQQEQHTATFTGHVVAVQGDMHLKSEKMIVYYHSNGTDPGAPKPAVKPADKSDTNGQNSIQKIDVSGGVFLSTPEETASGDNGVYDVENKKITLNQNVVLTRDKNTLKGTKLIYDFGTGKSNLYADDGSEPGKPKGRVKALFVPNKNESLAPTK